MAQARVPKFGNWEEAGNAPYTQYFNNARKGRNAGKLFNPNDPNENPEAFPEDVAPVHAPQFRTGSDPQAPKPKDERRMGKEDGNAHQHIDSPKHHGTMMHKPSSNSSHHRLGDRANPNIPHKRGSRLSAGSDRSFEQSPLHPYNEVKSSSKGGVACATNNPGRSRTRTSVRGNETPEKGSTVPVFGEWNDKNPQAGESYTDIFNQVSQEKKHGSKSPIIYKETPNTTRSHQNSSSDFAQCTCFSWCRK